MPYRMANHYEDPEEQYEDVFDEDCVNFAPPNNNLDQNLANFLSAYNNQKIKSSSAAQNNQNMKSTSAPDQQNYLRETQPKAPGLTSRRRGLYGDIHVEPTTSTFEDLDVKDMERHRHEGRGRGARLRKYYNQYNTNIEGIIRTELGTNHHLSNLEDPKANRRPATQDEPVTEVDDEEWMKKQTEDTSELNKYQGWVPKYTNQLRNDLPLYIGNQEDDQVKPRSAGAYPQLGESHLSQLTSRMTLDETDAASEHLVNKKVNTGEVRADNEDTARAKKGKKTKGHRNKCRPLD